MSRRRSRVVVLAALAACSYDAPEYGDARFRCDPAHACPGDQVCVAGLCQPPGTAGDAAASDGPPLDGRHDGLACGTMTCGAGQECCNDVVAGPRCQLASAGCAGLSTECDGPEDCPGGDCCLTAGGGACVARGACATGPLCHEAGDCPEDAPMCCTAAQVPWRGCFATCP